MVNNINTAALFRDVPHRPLPLAAKNGKTAPSNHNGDTVEISQESQAQFVQNYLKNNLSEQMETARLSAEAQAEFDRKMQMLFEIAARIMRGDNVPQSDKNFLGEHSPGLLMLAMSSRNQDNENPIDHEPLARESGNQANMPTAVNTNTQNQGQAAQQVADRYSQMLSVNT